MRLSDLPHFVVASIEASDTTPRLVGHLTSLVSVREGRSWLYAPEEALIGDLEDLTRATKAAVFTAPFWTPGSPGRIGASPPWLDGYWQAAQVTRILDVTHEWARRVFAASDAQYFVQGGVVGWQPAAHELPVGAVPSEVRGGAWDHEHCDLCSAKIGSAGQEVGYVDAFDVWLCEDCYRRYAEPHDLSFLAPRSTATK